MTTIVMNISYFLFASIAARSLGFIKSFWLARILGPSDYGVLIFIMLLSSYAPILTLGTVETLVKKVPFFSGKGDVLSAQEIEKGVFTFMLMVCALLVFAIFLVPFILTSEHLRRYVLPTRLMLLAVALSMFSDFLYFRLIAHNKFNLTSAITTARAIFIIFLQIPLGYAMGLTGAVLGFLICDVIILVYSIFLSRKLPNTLRFRFGRSFHWMLIKTGLPITIVWWTFMIQTSVDRLVSMSMLGEAATGYYGIGMSITAAYLLLPDAVNRVLYPSVNKKRGQTLELEDLIPLVVSPAQILSILLPFLSCAFVLILPLLFTFIVPQYMPGLYTAQILITGALFSGLTRGGANLFIAIDKQKFLLALILGSTVLNVIGNVILVKLGMNIVGLAISTAFSSALLAITIWLFVFKSFGYSVKKRLMSTIELFTPAFIFTVLTFANHTFFNLSSTKKTLTSLLLIGLQLLVYCGIIFSIPRYRRYIGDAIGYVKSAIRARLKGGERNSSPSDDEGQVYQERGDG